MQRYAKKQEKTRKIKESFAFFFFFRTFAVEFQEKRVFPSVKHACSKNKFQQHLNH